MEGVYLKWVNNPQDSQGRALTIVVLRSSGSKPECVTVTYQEALQVMTAVQEEQQRRTGA